MHLLFKPQQVKLLYILYSEAIKNTIMENSSFVRLIYSTPNFSTNGIFILFNNNTVQDSTTIYSLLEYITKLEIEILDKFNSNKLKCLKINDYLLNSTFRNYDPYKYFNHSFILKISGIWETNNNFGVTFKVIYSN